MRSKRYWKEFEKMLPKEKKEMFEDETFNIVPGMSTWHDQPEKYKQAYYKKIKKEEVIIEDEPININIVEELSNKKTCPTCGKEVPENKTYCNRACFLNRFKN